MKPIRWPSGTALSAAFNALRRNQEEIPAAQAGALKSPWWVDLDVARPIHRRPRGRDGGQRCPRHHCQPDIDIVIRLIGGYGITPGLRTGKPLQRARASGHRQQSAAGHAWHRDFATASAPKRCDGRLRGRRIIGKASSKALRDGQPHQWLAGISRIHPVRMRDKGLDFDEVLKEAQRLGYAEADPPSTSKAWMPHRKATLMSAIALWHPRSGSTRPTSEGITKAGAQPTSATPSSWATASSCWVLPTPATGIELRVHPSLVPAKRLIANVEGAMNAVVVNGAVGTTLYLRQGCGRQATASAVIADRWTSPACTLPTRRTVCPPGLPAWRTERSAHSADERSRHQLLRLRVADQAGVAGQGHRHPGRWGISIDAVLQREADEVGGEAAPRPT